MPMKKKQAPLDTEFILLFLAGVFVVSDSVIGPISNLGFGSVQLLSSFFEYFGIFIGLLLIVAAIIIYNTEGRSRRMWGTAALIFSLLSLLAGGGFLAGFILGLIGSIFVLRHKG